MPTRKTLRMPPAMILCGGQGTRLRDVSEILPKPMVPVGGQPILWHIMKSYAAHGVNRFILCLGYKREVIVDYFLNYRARATDLTVRLGQAGRVTFHGRHEEDWEVTLADTGEQTMTGGRVGIAAKYLKPTDKEFFLTYGDGVSDIDITASLRHHRAQRPALTVSAVHPAGRFGEMQLRQGRVTGFHEKPQTEAGLINGGFMVVDRGFIPAYLSGAADEILEQAPMRKAAHEGQMSAFIHEGFWQCMDTPREHQLLNQLWQSGKAPWTAAW